jgi:NADPH:quinone reductase
MKAICIETVAGKPELFLREIAAPEPGPAEVLVRVRAAGVNFADLYRVTNHYGSGRQEAAVAGLEMAGEIAAVGAEVSGWKIGDRVMAMAGGTYAEYCKVDHRLLLRVPAALGWEAAAATPVAFMTAHDALASNGELQRGEAVLVQAASSVIGIAAVQLAKWLGAGLVMGTSTSPAKLERLRALGLDLPIHSPSTDFAQAVLDATGGKGADVIIENIGGDTLPGDIRCAAVKGRIVNVGRLGEWNGTVDLNEHSRKRLKLIGVTFRTRSVEEHAEVARRCEDAVGPGLADRVLQPVVDRVFPLADAAAAQDYVRSRAQFGKVVLQA